MMAIRRVSAQFSPCSSRGLQLQDALRDDVEE
jgi:hypothetical protein